MAIVQVTLDEMMDEAAAKPFPARDKIIEILRNSPCADKEDLLDPDCPPLTAWQLRHAMPLSAANPKMYAEIEAARARALARKEKRERQTRESDAPAASESSPQKEREECGVQACFA